MICYKDEKATIAYLEQEQAIACSWEGEVPSALFQEVMQLKLQHMRAFSAKNWMMDIRHMQAISFDDQQWLWEGGWMQAFLQLPIRKVAIIQSYDVYNGMVLEAFLRYVSEHGACEVQFFSDFEASLDWIRDFSASSFELRTGTA